MLNFKDKVTLGSAFVQKTLFYNSDYPKFESLFIHSQFKKFICSFIFFSFFGFLMKFQQAEAIYL